MLPSATWNCSQQSLGASWVTVLWFLDRDISVFGALSTNLIPSYLGEGRHLPWPKLGNSHQNNLDGFVTLQEKRKNNCQITVCPTSPVQIKKKINVSALKKTSWLDGVPSYSDNSTLEELFTADMLMTFNDGSECPSKGSKWASMQSTVNTVS